MDTIQAIQNRFSYRGKYLAAPVPRDDLHRIMQAGLAAPSGCHMQTTSLIAVDDSDLMVKIGRIIDKPGFSTAPAGICVLTQEIPGFGDILYNVQDYAAAIENMLLAITAMGYASCWVEGYVSAVSDVGERIAALLGVPGDIQLVAYLPVGQPAEEGSRVTYKPFEERAWFNGYRRG